jgi:hypothetical protein
MFHLVPSRQTTVPEVLNGSQQDPVLNHSYVREFRAR